MDEESLKLLQSGSEDDVCMILKKFNQKHAQSFAFPDLTRDTKKRLIEVILSRLNGKISSLCSVLGLESIRILSREKVGMETMTSEMALQLMICLAGLKSYTEDMDAASTIQEGDFKGVHLIGVNIIGQYLDTARPGRVYEYRSEFWVMVEAQKCLCNIIFNSPAAQRICSANGCVEGIVQRLKTYKDPDLIHDIKFFDMRILFLLTALCADIRPKLRQDLHGFTYLIEVLDLALRDAEEKDESVPDADVDLCCEILKILFNLTVSINKNNLDEEEEAHFMRLVSVLHDLLVCTISSKEKREELHSHTVNLLTNMPRDSYEELLTPLNEGAVGGMDNKDVEYDGKNMEAIVVLLDFLHKRLDRSAQSPSKSLKESLTPILHCLCETCRANRHIRKFCRIKVLPYLRDDVKRLPEEGNTLRNKLCRLLTNPVTEVKDLAADLLFVLCKESVTRFVKYTGFGNAAGLLAQRGLMCGGRGTAEYSSESEDSDTEEYSTLKPMVNPVTGRWEEEKPDPMEGMTEEQKEFEAMQLVNKIDKLTRQGIIQPSQIGPDGNPVPVEHVLQLADAMAALPPIRDEEDSD